VILRDFVISLAENVLRQPERYLRPGCNGPYDDPETPVRVLGHWLITFSKCYEWTGDEKFKDRVAQCAEYLCSREARPHGFSFHHRNKEGKDKCNGLIGQAWTFEALAAAGKCLGSTEFERLAEQVFFQHSFDESTGLWMCMEVDGKVLSLDSTFNHQLWFAACSSLIDSGKKEEIGRRVLVFLNCLENNLTVLENGLIYHPIKHLYELQLKSRRQSKGRKLRFARILRRLTGQPDPERAKRDKEVERAAEMRLISKSTGYHSFCMYAFGLLKQTLPEHPIWNSEVIGNMVSYMLTEEYKEAVGPNPYSYPYNPPGFEVPYVLSVFGAMPKDDITEACSWWVNEQLRQCYNGQSGVMDRNTTDPVTATARIYEVTRLEEPLLGQTEVRSLTGKDGSL